MERIVGGVTAVTVGSGVASRVLDGLTGRAAIVCQPGSEAIARSLGDLPVLVMPDREGAKTMAAIESAVEWLAATGIRRDGAVVAVGGGALTDAVGFLASIYLRGIEARFVPTTLLAAIDASIGGKNGVNVAGKNLAGTFAHPAAVVVDLDLIGSTPEPLLREGMAEAIKAGAIADPGLLEAIESAGLGADLRVVVERSVTVKADVVDDDFREQGRRAILNFGHTIGHAVEFLAGWSHGESVAVGMVAASAASERVVGFDETSRILGALEAVGLPTTGPTLPPADVLKLIAVDKKADAVGVRMVLLEGIGRPVVSHVDSATLGAALAAIGIGGS